MATPAPAESGAHRALWRRFRHNLRILHVLAAMDFKLKYAGSALGARLGDPIRLGDYSLLWASVVAWAGILVVAVTTILGPTRAR